MKDPDLSAAMSEHLMIALTCAIEGQQLLTDALRMARGLEECYKTEHISELALQAAARLESAKTWCYSTNTLQVVFGRGLAPGSPTPPRAPDLCKTHQLPLHEDHTCPRRVELDDDGETLCDCCPACREECRDSI